MKRSSSKKSDTIPSEDFVVSSGGSPRDGGCYRRFEVVAAKREATRKRLSRELVRGNRRKKIINDDDDDNEKDNKEDDEDEEHDGGLFGGAEGGGMKMSLIYLLDKSDRQVSDEDEDNEEVEEGDEYGENGKGELCCVCKVKHKGFAFITCGHTFCRLCSKQLCVEKGTCPICNDFAVEVLDVF